MGFGRYRFRRSFGQVASQFRGARPDTYPLTQSLLSLYPATAAYSAYDLGNKRGAVTEAEGTVLNPVQRWRRSSDDALQMFTASQIASGAALNFANHNTTDLYNDKMYFDGVDDSISASEVATISKLYAEFIPAQTINAASTRSDLLQWDSANPANSFVFGAFTGLITNETFTISAATGNARTSVANYTFNAGTTYRILVEWNASESRYDITINDVLQSVTSGTTTHVPQITSVDLGIGSNSTDYFNGVIPSLAINDTDVVWDGTITDATNQGWTVNGTPVAYTGQPFDAYLLTEYDQHDTGLSGLYGSARYFNGSSTTVTTFSAETVPVDFQTLSDDIIIEATIVPTAVDSESVIAWSSAYTICELRSIGSLSAGEAVPFSLGINDGFLQIGVAINNSINAETHKSVTPIAVGELSTVKLVVSGDDYELHINGSLDASGTFSNTGNRSVGTTLSSLRVGARTTDGNAATNRFEGVIHSLALSTSSTAILSYTGLGNSVTAWEDTIGSNDGTETNGAAFQGQGVAYDLTQTTAANQPLVVSGGAWVDTTFDGVDDKLPFAGAALDIFKDVGYGQAFAVATSDEVGTSGSRIIEISSNASGARFLLGESTATAASYRVGGRRLDADAFDSTTASAGHGGTQKIITGLTNWADGEAYIYQNGVNVGTDLSFQTAGNTSNTTSNASNSGIGIIGFDGKISAVVVYNTDQTANRAAIEAKLNTIIPTY